MLGGVSGRGVQDSLIRILDSLDGDNLYVQEDLSKYFDGIGVSDMLLTLRRLGAPRQLAALLEDFHRNHHRVFSFEGLVGGWRRITCGVPQGCPLSPLVGGALMAVWSAVVEQGHVGVVDSSSYVDDRLMWSADAEALRGAKARSSAFDEAYGFRCDSSKCRFVHRSQSSDASELAWEIGYEVVDHLAILGLVVPLDSGRLPTLRDFDLMKACRRLRLIGVAVRGLARKQRFLRILVTPMLTWAGGFASLPSSLLETVVADVRWMLHKDLSPDASPVLTFEVGGWECHPGFARDMAAVRGAIRMQCRVPVWAEEASTSAGPSCSPWPCRCSRSWAGGLMLVVSSFFAVTATDSNELLSWAWTRRRLSSSGCGMCTGGVVSLIVAVSSSLFAGAPRMAFTGTGSAGPSGRRFGCVCWTQVGVAYCAGHPGA